MRVDRACALVIVDMQNDFMPSGTLPILGSDTIIPVLNKYIELFVHDKLPIFATRDWHPANHVSFKQLGGVWPMHCVKDTMGAEFQEELKIPRSTTVISKGYEHDKEAYSCFNGTELAKKLEQKQVKEILVGGVPTDYCVKNTVLDALNSAFGVVVLEDAIKGIKNGNGALKEMQKKGAKVAKFDEIVIT